MFYDEKPNNPTNSDDPSNPNLGLMKNPDFILVPNALSALRLPRSLTFCPFPVVVNSHFIPCAPLFKLPPYCFQRRYNVNGFCAFFCLLFAIFALTKSLHANSSIER